MKPERVKALALTVVVVLVGALLWLSTWWNSATPLAEAMPTLTETPTLTPEPTPTPSPTVTPIPPTPTTPAPHVAKVKEKLVNVRQGPGAEYSRAGQAVSGDELIVTGRNGPGDWLQVESQAKGLSGWILAELLDFSLQLETIPEVTPAYAPPTATPVPPEPTATPQPTATPTAAVDFRVTQAQLLNIDENGGCLGMHTIFITVLDAAGNPLSDIVVGDIYGNVETTTGSKGPGKAEIDLWVNTMELAVKRDKEGRTYTSEATRPMSSQTSVIPPEDKLAAGYCVSMGHCIDISGPGAGECHGHFSWRATFQRTW